MARVYISCAEQDLDLSARIRDWLRFQDYEPVSLHDDPDVEKNNIAQWHREYAQALEQCDLVILVLTPEWAASKWCFAEFTEAYSIGKTIFAVVEKPLNEPFSEPGISIFDLTSDREDGLASLAEALRGSLSNSTGGLDFDPDRSVYPGLKAYEGRDGVAFFCRDDDVRRIIDRLNTRRRQGGARLIALLGAPGTGISSLMMAGVLPRINRDQENWIVLPVMRPRLKPIEEFCRSISGLLGNADAWRDWADLFRGHDFKGVAREMADQLRERFGRPNAHILIPIDQAEELFSIADPDDASQFLDVLGAIFDDDMPYVGIAALRPDFLKDFQTADQLSHVVEEFSPRLMPLSTIREIITAPAGLVQLEIEDELVEEILSDALKEGALPLVALIMKYLYDNSGDGNELTLEAYRQIGNIYAGDTPLGNIIARLAEKVLEEEMPNEGQLLMLEDAFAKKLVWRDNDNRYVSRPAPLDDFNLKTRVFIRKFIDAGLLVPLEIDGYEMVEYTHLFILDHWPRLREWLDISQGEAASSNVSSIGALSKPERTEITEAQVLEPDEITSPREFRFQEESTDNSRFIDEAHNYVQGEIIEPERYDNGLNAEEQRLSSPPSIFADQEDRYAKAASARETKDTEAFSEDLQSERDVPEMFTRSETSLTVSDGQSSYNYDQDDYSDEDLVPPKKRRRGKLFVAAVFMIGIGVAGAVYWPIIKQRIDEFQNKQQREASLKKKETKTVAPTRKIEKATKNEAQDKKEIKQASLPSGTDNKNNVAEKPDKKENTDRRLANQKLNDRWPFLRLSVAFESVSDPSLSSDKRKKAQLELAEYLQQMKTSLILTGHEGRVRYTSFSPDGKFLVTASEDRTVRVWDLLTGNDVLIMKGHKGPVNTAIFSPDGKHILSASDDGSAIVWNAVNGKIVQTLKNHEKAVKFAVYDSAGKRIATASSDKSVNVWDVDSNKVVHTLKGHEAAITAVAFSKNGSWIATGSQDQTARIWDATSGQQVLVLNGHKGGVRSVKFSNDSNLVLTGSEDQTVILWQTFSAKKVNTFIGHLDAVVSVDFSPDESIILSTSVDGKGILWSKTRGVLMSNIKNRANGFRQAVFSKRGQWIAGASQGNEVHILPSQFYINTKQFEGHTDRVFSSVFGEDNEYILTASRDSTARIWNVETKSQVKMLAGHIGQIHHSVFSPDGKTVATASKDKTVRIWDRKSGRELKRLEGPGGAVNRISYNQEGTILAGASQDGKVYIWNIETGDIVHTLNGHGGAVWSVIFSRGGNRVYSSSEDKSIIIWNADTGEKIETLKGHASSVLAIALSEDGSTLASGSADKTVRFWDLKSGKAAKQILKHDSYITSVAFNSQGDKVITGSFDKKALIWDKATGKVIWRLETHDDRVMSVGFSEEGNWALTSSSDKAFMWRIFSAPEMAFYVKQVMPRCLTKEERKKLEMKGNLPSWCKEMEELRALKSQ